MRRSSWAILGLASLIFVAAIALYRIPVPVSPPPMTPTLATAILERGKAALERRDTEAILSLMAPNAAILGVSPAQMRTILNRAMEELSPGHLTVAWRNLDVHTVQGVALISFEMDVDQKTRDADIRYYRSRIQLRLEIVTLSHWLGLYTTRDWKITRVDSDESFDIPTE